MGLEGNLKDNKNKLNFLKLNESRAKGLFA